MIKFENVEKRYKDVTALDNISFETKPGRITGLIGPNGSGKSTAFKILLGLARPTSGLATVFGKKYKELAPNPLLKVGALLDGIDPLPERRAIDHLKWIAASNGISFQRVEEVLSFVHLEKATHKRVKQYSLGMKQRLGIATAMLGHPEIIILDEPMNGLDPEGIRWIRDFMKEHANQGGTVLVSSHLMKELEDIADDVVLLVYGKLLQSGSLDEVIGTHSSLEEAYFHLTSKGMNGAENK